MIAPTWARSYRRDWLRPDLVAGVVIWSVVTPQALAYELVDALEADGIELGLANVREPALEILDRAESRRREDRPVARPGDRLAARPRLIVLAAMGDAIGQVLSFAVGVALSPIPIIGVVLMLGTPRARSNGPAFILGWLIGLTVVGTIVLLVASGAGAERVGRARRPG